MSDDLLVPIIDSHVHLWPQSEQDQLRWLSPDHELYGQHSVAEYKAATASAPSLLGYIFIESDRKFDIENEGEESSWEMPLAEVRWAKRLALGQPKEEGEGLEEDDGKSCLGIVPWAPMSAAPQVLEKYIAKAQEEAGEEAWAKVKGFRYLVQDKPHGTMLSENFIANLKYLGKNGYAFDVGIDQHRRGRKQLEECIEMIEKAHEGVPEEQQVTLILNHLCKPDMTIYNTTSDKNFHAWRTAMYTLSKANKTYMKLSGGFSEMPDRLRNTDSASHIFQSTLAWMGIVLATFGAERIMFGSDWPVCEAGGLKENGWPRWKEVVDKTCWMATLSDEERVMIFGGTAKKAYNL